MGIIYKLTSPENKSYIGKTTDILYNRWYKHISKINNNNSECKALEEAVNKYGSETFKLEILFECSINELDYYESAAIKYFNTLAPKGYNLTTGGRFTSYSNITKQKMKSSALKRDKSIYRTSTESKQLPEYVIFKKRNGKITGVQVARHPSGVSKSFTNCETLEENINEAIEYLRKVDSGEIIPEKRKKESNLPKYIQRDTYGYKVIYLDENGNRKTKRFNDRKVDKQTLLNRAIECNNEINETRLLVKSIEKDIKLLIEKIEQFDTFYMKTDVSLKILEYQLKNMIYD